VRYATTSDATTYGYYNEQFLNTKIRTLQRTRKNSHGCKSITVRYAKMRVATTYEFYNEWFSVTQIRTLQWTRRNSHGCKSITVRYATTNDARTYKCYNQQVLITQIRTVQRTRRNILGRRSKCVCITCRALPLWLERQSSSLLPSVRSSYQFSSVICLFVQCITVKYINFILFLHYIFILCYIFPV
jgi:hypothetical protein